MTHTSTPWQVSNFDAHQILGREGNVPVQICEYVGRLSDAEFIVRACNAHDDLLAALQSLTDRARGLNQSASADGLINCNALAQARAAIQKASE